MLFCSIFVILGVYWVFFAYSVSLVGLVNPAAWKLNPLAPLVNTIFFNNLAVELSYLLFICCYLMRLFVSIFFYTSILCYVFVDSFNSFKFRQGFYFILFTLDGNKLGSYFFVFSTLFWKFVVLISYLFVCSVLISDFYSFTSVFSSRFFIFKLGSCTLGLFDRSNLFSLLKWSFWFSVPVLNRELF